MAAGSANRQLNARGDSPPVDADLVQDEVIGRLGLDVPPPDVGGREMLQIAGDDDLSTGLDRRCQHVPVAWIRELEPFDERFVPGDEAVSDRPFISCRRRSSLSGRFGLSALEHLIENLVGPLARVPRLCSAIVHESVR